MDWHAWHKHYDSNSALQRRLELVHGQIAAALAAAPPGEIRLISVCAGDGRDVLGALAGHPRAGDVRARLVELDAKLVAAGRAAAGQAGLADRVTFVQADAARSLLYDGIAPAHVVVMAGMIGLVDAAGIPGIVGCLRALTAKNGRVIWTRNLDFRDGRRHGALLRRALAAGAFETAAMKMTSWTNLFRRVPQARFLVAAHVYRGDPVPLPADTAFFHIAEADDVCVPA